MEEVLITQGGKWGLAPPGFSYIALLLKDPCLCVSIGRTRSPGKFLYNELLLNPVARYSKYKNIIIFSSLSLPLKFILGLPVPILFHSQFPLKGECPNKVVIFLLIIGSSQEVVKKYIPRSAYHELNTTYL